MSIDKLFINMKKKRKKRKEKGFLKGKLMIEMKGMREERFES